MPPETNEPIDLLDLKLLPAWVKESPDGNAYADFEGDDAAGADRRGGRMGGGQRRPQGRDNWNKKRPAPGAQRPTPRAGGEGRPRGQQRRDRPPQRGRPQDRPRADRPREDRDRAPERPPIDVAVRFIPHPAAFESVAAQIKAEALAYSVFSLARLFLQKPERYDVHVAAKPESPLYQLGENGAISAEKPFLENSAFRLAQSDFYKPETTQTDPIKGNFSSIARDRLSGTVLGPTNYHDYQRKLRGLYEQRFSRRMSFPDFQRQIEIVSDPALVEQWKEEARMHTTFTTTREEPPQTFNTAAEAEKHFRQHYLPSLIRPMEETTIGGVASRNLPDRALRRAIENAWTMQTRSPSQMMAELSNCFREAGLHIFRHRKGMLFVSPVRVRPFVHEEASVSPHVRVIVEAIGANPRINRKDLAEKLLVDVPAEEAESRKLALASDLKWLISEGYVIEFNDGSLDLPRAKVKPVETGAKENAPAEVATAAGGSFAPSDQNASSADGVVAATVVPTADQANEAHAEADTSTNTEEAAEIGGR